ncbi:MAG: primosomal protein N' [Alphaproteobacteria bacterium]|nr:MAG: primosomal protein N' [Alphaproteobacteria bacterium]
MRAVRLSVLPAMPFDRAWSYLGDPHKAPPGSLVRVPFGRQETLGLVLGEAKEEVPDPARLKTILEVLPGSPLDPALCRFIDRFADYTLTPRGQVLRLVAPPALAFGRSRRRTMVRATGMQPARLTPARKRVLERLAEDGGREWWPLAELARRANVSEGVVRALIEQKILEGRKVAADAAPLAVPDPTRAGPALTPAQRAAADEIGEAVTSGGYRCFLLDGVTGSGKTEVYFEAIAAALTRAPEAQVLVLLPEIALTGQWLARFAARFGTAPAVWHSDMGPADRRRVWQAVRSGEARVVVGARSALFLPFAELALIVVDEEHDPSYKQDEGVTYHARDMAVLRAHLEVVPVVLASATPSLESWWNAGRGRYRHLRLTDRYGGARLPRIRALDLRRQPLESGRWLAPPLVAAIEERLARGEQSLLYLNRRGYAPVTLCRACGGRIECPHCTAWLVEHRYERRLVCHHCGYRLPVLSHCPHCEAQATLVPCGPGVERLAEEIVARWPTARLMVMASDTVSRPESAREAIARIERGEIDILVGTQIVTKGYHFPRLTLVGVVDADLGLRGGDLRAGERSFQQIWQVAGRAGRAEFPGEVMLQTFDADHPVIRALASGERDAFFAAELAARRAAGMPPFGRLAALVFSGRDEARVAASAAAYARAFSRLDPALRGESRLYGPAPAPLARIAGRFRHRLLLHTPRSLLPQPLIRRWLAELRPAAGVRLRVDIDPHHFL